MKKRGSIIIVSAVSAATLAAVGITAMLTVLNPQARIARISEAAADTLSNGNYSEAAELFDKLTRIDDTQSEAWLDKINAQLMQNDYIGAADSFSEFVSKPYSYYSGVNAERVNKMIDACITGIADKTQLTALRTTLESNGWLEEHTNIVFWENTVAFGTLIGEINGKIYSVYSNVPTCEPLPISPTMYPDILEFAVYEGYVYYLESDPSSQNAAIFRYRATDQVPELVLAYEDINTNTPKSFHINNGVIYYDRSSESDYTFDLNTMQKGTDAWKMYLVDDYPNTVYASIFYKNEVVFKGKKYFMIGKDGNYREMTNIAPFNGNDISIYGTACGYIYFTAPSNGSNTLYRAPINGGEQEIIMENINE